MMTKKTLLLALALYIASSLVTYGAMSVKGQQAVIIPDSGTDSTDGTPLGNLLQIDPAEPKDQPCPLNGKLYTATEKAAWEKKRPIFVMVENTPDARPQAGLSQTDVVFETVAESGITRFAAGFYCDVQTNDTIVAPVRSARSYFVDWVSGFNRPLYSHVGGGNLPGPADALGQLEQYDWRLRNDIDGLSIGLPTYYRKANRIPGKTVDTEHTMETSTERLWAVGAKRGWTNMSPQIGTGKNAVAAKNWQDGYTGWSFEDGKSGAGSVNKIAYEFWTGYSDYAVEWNYDSTTNSYKRNQGDAPHVDINNDKQIAASNVVVLLTTEKGPIDEKKHMLYGTTGTGDALIFKNGEAIKAVWSKKDRQAELVFTDAKGKAITLTRGLVWISVLNKTNTVSY